MSLPKSDAGKRVKGKHKRVSARSKVDPHPFECVRSERFETGGLPLPVGGRREERKAQAKLLGEKRHWLELLLGWQLVLVE